MNQITDNQKFINAIKYVYYNIDKPLTLDQVAKQVALSTASLKRLFLQITGQSAGRFIRKLRMELAFKRLHSTDESILETALEVGFENHASFSRCFKQLFGFPPHTARKKIHIINELESVELTEPTYVTLENIQIQGTTAQGTYWEASPTAWIQLAKTVHKKENVELDDEIRTYIGISHDNPHDDNVDHDKVRFTAGIFNASEEYEELQTTTIPGGKYAQFHYRGKLANLGMPFHYIYGAWNKQKNNLIDLAKPTFIIFDRFPHKFDDHQLIITVPLKK